MALPFGLMVGALGVASAFAIDYGAYVTVKSDLQGELDRAALSSASAFISAADQVERDRASYVDTQTSKWVELIKSDSRQVSSIETSYSIDHDATTVTINAVVTIDTVTARMVGTDTMTLKLQSSAAAVVDSQPVCILALDPNASTGITFEGDGELKAKDCVVWSNSQSMRSIDFDGRGKVKTERLCAVGKSSPPGRYSVEPGAEDDCSKVSDPLADWEPPIVGACTSNNTDWIKSTTTQLEPGVYCGGLRVDAKNIFLKPGLYVIKDGPLILRGQSKIKGEDIGILLTGEDSFVDIDGKAKVELRSAETGDMSGIAIAADRTVDFGKSLITGRSDLKIGGVIYLPTHDLRYWGESDTRAASPVTTIISNSLTIGGDAYLEVKNSKDKAKYAPALSTGLGSVRLIY